MRLEIAVLGVIVLAACEPLPPLDYESEHALVGTDQVERVCAGSLERIDWTIEYVDEALGRATDGEPARVYVLDAEQVYERCNGDVVGGCVRAAGVYITPASFDEVLTHEIVHERITRTPANNSKAIFNEGIACAIGGARKPPSDGSPRAAVSSYITAIKDLWELSYGYFYAGELVHWLIETHGMTEVLEFMDDVGWASTTDQVRAKYSAHFGTAIDDDLFEHVRAEEDLTRANVICTGPEIAVDPQRRRIHLEADFACDSPRVENDWVFPDRVYVEWVVEIAEDQAGLWAPVRFVDDGTLPGGTLLEIERCAREDRNRRTWSNGRNRPVALHPGLYRIRWHGPMDGDDELDLELGGPCDEVAQDCEAGERCASPGVCVPFSG